MHHIETVQFSELRSAVTALHLGTETIPVYQRERATKERHVGFRKVFKQVHDKLAYH